MQFIIENGKIKRDSEASAGHTYIEDAFILTQKVWFGFGGIPLFHENMELMEKQAVALNFFLPEEFRDRRELLRLTKRMLNKNKFYRSGYIFYHSFYRREKIYSIVTGRSSSEFDFPFSKDGILISFSDQKKTFNKLNRFAFFNKIIWDASLRKLKDTYFQNSIILNEKNMVCECAYGNIFMLRGNKLITPALSTGCYEDLMRGIVIEEAQNFDITVDEKDNISKNDLLAMDEIFIAGEQSGVNWILGVDNKRFIHTFSLDIYNKINEGLKLKTS